MDTGIRPFTVAIVGGGASGVLTAAHILRRGDPDVRVVLIEPQALGAGAAYGTDAPEHRLNVRSSRMSAYDDAPGDFVRWLTRYGHDADPEGFAPRGLYRQYLQTVLGTAIAGRPNVFEHRRETVSRIVPSVGWAEVHLSGGERLAADRVVVALGNMTPRDPSVETPWYYDEPSYIRTPWTTDFERIAPKDEVLILGTGLTAADVYLTLESREHRGRVTAVSRHGRWPYPHCDAAGLPFTLDPATLPVHGPGLLRAIRDAIAQADMAGVPWQQVIDALRPISNVLWQRASDADRAQFMRHLSPLWNTARHRLPLDTQQAMAAATARGQLRTVAGRLQRVDRFNSMLAATVKVSGGGVFRAYPKWIINCTGPHGDIRTSPSRLVQRLLADGVAVPNALDMGFETDAHGALVDASGRTSNEIFAIGPMRRGGLLETTAIAEIRQQAAILASLFTGQRASVAV